MLSHVTLNVGMKTYGNTKGRHFNTYPWQGKWGDLNMLFMHVN